MRDGLYIAGSGYGPVVETSEFISSGKFYITCVCTCFQSKLCVVVEKCEHHKLSVYSVLM